ncbi:hypothetical protein FKM82_021316 [Ascaphus truei]
MRKHCLRNQYKHRVKSHNRVIELGLWQPCNVPLNTVHGSSEYLNINHIGIFPFVVSLWRRGLLTFVMLRNLNEAPDVILMFLPQVKHCRFQ